MRPRCILLTGAAGFVGTHLMQRLAADFPAARLVACDADVTDADALARAFEAARPDACYHLAAVSAVTQAMRDPALAWRVNLHGTLNVARAILDRAPHCLLLYVSSADGYGASFLSGTRLDETALLAPMNMYGATKAAADLALGAMAADGLRCVRMRPFNHCGPGQSDAFVVSAFAKQIASIEAGRQERVISVGALEASRDFLDVRDVCAAYAACLAHAENLPSGAILNVASGTPRNVGQVLADMLGMAGLDVQIRPQGGLMRRADIMAALGDAGRARSLLHWAPCIAWEQTLADILQDWRARIAEAG